ncbi:MAG TPA: hypothetical protein VE983_10985 [Solirubrobacteraceae bacterium]|nr:hypothetical protein [Solirubrobacteraceae bacterium]
MSVLATAGALAFAVSPAAAARPRADQHVFGTVKAVSASSVVISHITTGRAVPASTLTFGISGALLSAPAHWVLEKDWVLADMLKNPFWKRLLKGSVSATTLLSQLLNPATPVSQSEAWVNTWGPVGPTYLAPGDLVYGTSALSAAQTARYELAGKPVPLIALRDEVDHVPAPPPTLAEKLQAKLFALELAALIH